MNLLDTFSPPVEVTLVTGDTVKFRRMLMEDWAKFCQQLDDERFEEAKKIVAADASLKPPEKNIALRRARDEQSDIYEVMHRYCRTAKGITALMKYALLENDKVDLLPFIEPHIITQVADAIIFAPIVPQDQKASVPPLEPSGGTNAASATSGTGDSTPPLSADGSTLNPAS